MSSIVLTGLASSDPIPGHYVEVKFAEGASSVGEGVYPVLLMGNKTSGGIATLDTVVYGPLSSPALTNESDAITLFGNGSELHRMVRYYLKVNTTVVFYAIAVTESAGLGATFDMVLSTTSTSAGTWRVWVCDEFCDIPISNGMAPGALATAAIAIINQNTHWPCVASVVTTTTVRLTAKQLGLRGNDLRAGNQIFQATGITSTNGAQAFFSGGTTSDSNTAAIATITGGAYYYNVSAASDVTQFGAICTMVKAQALPINGNLQRALTCSNRDIATATPLATDAGVNTPRAEIGWLEECDLEPPCMAAQLAGVYALEESTFPPRTAFSSYGNDTLTGSIWTLQGPRSGKVPSRTNLSTAILSGLTPIGVNRNRSTYIVRRVTTRTLNGSTPDYRIRDAHKVTVCDLYANELRKKFTLELTGFKIGDDPVDAGDPPPGDDVATPRMVKAIVNQMTRVFGNVSLLEQVQTTINTTVVVRETSPNTRMSIRVPLYTISNLEQTATSVDQVG